MLHISQEEALELGMTHEGTLYGVQVWYSGDPEDLDSMSILPKFIPALAWLFLADAATDLFCFLANRNICVEPKDLRKISKQSLI